MPKTNLQQHILIDALPSKVWKVLTCSSYLVQYLFEGNVHCRWTEGSPLTLVDDAGGALETTHKGNVEQVVPGVLLKYNLQGKDSLCIDTTYELIPAENGVQLKIHCEGFEDSEEEFTIRVQQIRLLLQKIKWLAEYA